MISHPERRFLTDAWHEAGATFEVTEPATGSVLGVAADCGEAEARSAIDIAHRAFQSWRQTTAFERSKILRRWFELIMEQQDDLGRSMTREMGKPLREAKGEAVYAANFVEWYAEEAKRVYGEVIQQHVGHKRLLALRQPVGVAYAITPWNFPAGMITRKAAPALAAGCTMIVKPAAKTPFTALMLADLWLQAGGPPGTLQVLPTTRSRELTPVMMADARVRKLTFTGSTEVGKLLYRQSADTMKRMSLELGGHAPYLVFDDAHLDHAVREVLACKFRNAGQTCVCTNRIYVQDGIYDAFSEAFAKATEGLVVGDPLDEATDIGPLVDAQGLAKAEEHVNDAVSKGAKVLTGGAGSGGLYYQPTVLSEVQPGMKVLTEETFGPVAPIVRFSTEAEAVEQANATPYGLASYLYTRDIARALRVTEALDYGIVGVNDGVTASAHTPFGGVKDSGLGREGGKWGIEEYLDVKYVSIGLGD